MPSLRVQGEQDGGAFGSLPAQGLLLLLLLFLGGVSKNIRK